MTTRLLAAAVGLAVLLPSIIFGGQVAVDVIVPLVMALCLVEYAGMAFPEDRVVALAWLLVGGAAGYAALLYGPPAHVGLVVAVVAILTLVGVTLRPDPIATAADRSGRFLLGMGWIGLLAFFVLLRRLDDGLAWIFLVLVISWCGDTGGYFAGRAFGRHALYPAISPKKTWEGVAGGVVFATAGTFVVRAVGLPALTVVDCLVVGPLFCGIGIVGDLSESMLKRAFDVKDSGWFMPGHGGLLDRVDSVLFVAPLLYGYAVMVKG